MVYLDDLHYVLYDQMVDALVVNDLHYSLEFKQKAESEGFDFEQMLKDAADQIPDD